MNGLPHQDIYDLLIIGGGINGAGIARDAAGRGLKVLLVEQGDLACGTSSASTKLIHGGLRYLEQYEFRLVREALIEREVLLRNAPHIIRPLRFILPHERGLRPSWLIRLGLFLYDHLGGRETLPGSETIHRSDGLLDALQPRFRLGYAYSDCWVEDSRLVVLNALDARERGATIKTRTRFLSAARADGIWRAQVSEGDARRAVAARVLINAAGPWLGEVLTQGIGQARARQLRLVKGSHIVVPRLFPGEHAFILQNRDRRIVFAIPYEQRFTLIGTTDIPFEGDPAGIAISPEETAYLCDVINGYFRKSITPESVVHSYAGVRPLHDDDSTASASTVTRDYVLDLAGGQGEAPLLTIYGGKITTYRRLAEHALEKLQPSLATRARAWTSTAPLPGGDIPGADFARFATEQKKRYAWLAPETVHRLARAYGTRIGNVLGDARGPADLGEQFAGDFYEREAEYLVQAEWARTAEDMLWRRSKLGLHLPSAARDKLAAWLARHRIAAEMQS
ncbi:MAG TPA: glycerol-3-phosphate dehydrogenase [Dongiaceae bacterium]|nr:glycerol-3-phosphate dehydrogenase [Dongiaceae bacterium]